MEECSIIMLRFIKRPALTRHASHPLLTPSGAAAANSNRLPPYIPNANNPKHNNNPSPGTITVSAPTAP